MTYTYKYKDGDRECFELTESMKATPLKEHNGRPCGRVITGGSGTVFKEGGVGWPDREHRGDYTRANIGADGNLQVLK